MHASRMLKFCSQDVSWPGCKLGLCLCSSGWGDQQMPSLAQLSTKLSSNEGQHEKDCGAQMLQASWGLQSPS